MVPRVPLKAHRCVGCDASHGSACRWLLASWPPGSWPRRSRHTSPERSMPTTGLPLPLPLATSASPPACGSKRHDVKLPTSHRPHALRQCGVMKDELTQHCPSLAHAAQRESVSTQPSSAPQLPRTTSVGTLGACQLLRSLPDGWSAPATHCCEIAITSRLLITGHAVSTLASSERSKPRISGALTSAHAEKCERDSAALCSGIRPTSSMSGYAQQPGRESGAVAALLGGCRNGTTEMRLDMTRSHRLTMSPLVRNWL